MLTNIAVASDGTTLYAFGGRNGSGRHSQAYKYNYATDSWTAIARFPYDAIAEAEAEYGHNGKIYVIWWNGTYIYDIATNSWSLGASPPQSEFSFGHAYWNGKIYVIGGYVNDAINAVYTYDIATDSWSTLAPLPQAEGLMAAAAINGKIYVANGQTAGLGETSNLYIYDIATDSWTQGPSSPHASSAPGSAAIGGKLFMIGGNSTGSNTYTYDPATDSWSQGPSLNLARGGGNAATINTPGAQTAIVVGGAGGNFWTNSVEASTAPLVPCATPSPTLAPSSTPTATYTASSTTVPPTVTSTAITPSGTAVPPSNTVPVPTSTIVPPTSTACAISWSDVPPGSPFYTYIRCLSCRYIISGYSDGTFRPNNNITRGQIAKLVSNAANFQDPIPPDRQTYEDVPYSNAFWLWIERLTLHGAINGYRCGSTSEPCIPPANRPYFRPYNNATRAQLSKIVANAYGAYPPPTGQMFEDVPTTHPFYRWIEQIVEAGVIGGYRCGGNGEPCIPPANRPYFRPYNDATRGQAARIVANAFFPNCQTPGRR